MEEVFKKLKALRNVIVERLKADHRGRNPRYFDPPTVLEYFERFALIRDELKGVRSKE